MQLPMMRRVGALLICCACLHCGGETLTGPTTPPPAPPGTPVPPGSPGPIPPPPVASQVFVGAGDIAMCGSTAAESTAKLLDGIGGTVFTLGDNAYFSGTRQEFRDCYEPTWGRHKGRTFPVPGNHDYNSPGAAPYYEYFGVNSYYSHEVGAWHAIALNSNVPVGANSAQGQWLRSDLASSPRRCTVAYWHHPLFSSGPNGDSPEMRDFWRLLYDAGADLVLVGHDHDYERFAPQDPDGRPDPARGIRQFVVGTGGATPYMFITLRANSEVRLTPVFGVLKLTLQADSYNWEFIPVAGRGDSGSGQCH